MHSFIMKLFKFIDDKNIKKHKAHKGCTICGICLEKENKAGKNNQYYNQWTVDHIISKKSANNELINLQLTCYSCNQIKGGRCLHPDDKIEYKEIKVFLITEIKILILFKCKLCFKIIHSSSKNYESSTHP